MRDIIGWLHETLRFPNKKKPSGLGPQQPQPQFLLVLFFDQSGIVYIESRWKLIGCFFCLGVDWWDPFNVESDICFLRWKFIQISLFLRCLFPCAPRRGVFFGWFLTQVPWIDRPKKQGELFRPLIASTFGCSTNLLVIQNSKLGAFSTRNSARNSERRGDIFDTSLKLKESFTEHVENPGWLPGFFFWRRTFNSEKVNPSHITSYFLWSFWLVDLRGLLLSNMWVFRVFTGHEMGNSPHFPSGLIQKAVFFSTSS